jgi:hypothetical protein
MVEFADSTQWSTEIGSEQGGDNTQTDKTHTDIESRLERTAKGETDAEADNGEKNRHHDTGSQANDIAKYLFHERFVLFVSKRSVCKGTKKK